MAIAGSEINTNTTTPITIEVSIAYFLIIPHMEKSKGIKTNPKILDSRNIIFSRKREKKTL